MTSADKKLLTIVVPIYNVEKYLNECLDSFALQTNQNFRVLLIDDGSKDSSGSIAKEYANKNPQLFSYVFQENKGLGGARNTGLDLVDSEYVMFFDSDDFMASRAVENIYKTLEKHSNSVDIVFFNPVIYNMATNSYELWHDHGLMSEIFNGKDVLNPSETPRLMETEASVCRAIWRTEFLKSIGFKFIEHVHWEDVPPHFLVMHNAKSAVFMDYHGAYYYRFNSGNQITSGGGKSRLDMEIIFNAILPYFKDKSWSKDEKVFMIAFLANYLFWSINVVDDEYLPQFINICHKFFKKISFGLYLKFFFKAKNCLRDKIMIWFLKSRILYKKLRTRDGIKKNMKIFKRFKGALKK